MPPLANVGSFESDRVTTNLNDLTIEDSPQASKRARSPVEDEYTGAERNNGLLAPSKRPRFIPHKSDVEIPDNEPIQNGNFAKANGREHIADGQKNFNKFVNGSRKRALSEDFDMGDAHTNKKIQIDLLQKKPHGSFGLFSDDEATEDDEVTGKVRQGGDNNSLDKIVGLVEKPIRLTFFQKLDAAMKQRELEIEAEQKAKLEAERTKVIYNSSIIYFTLFFSLFWHLQQGESCFGGLRFLHILQLAFLVSRDYGAI